MTFEWLDKFQKESKKAADYAEKTLKAYKLGMKAKGSIRGVQIMSDPDGCDACRRLDSSSIYEPDEAPRIPLPECDRAESCRCIYRPVMTYQLTEESPDSS